MFLVEHAVDCCVGDAVSDFYLADINGDGRVEALVREFGARNEVRVGWYPVDDHGMFGNQRLLRNEDEHLIPTDLNGDDLPDLLGTKSWRPNLGGGHFGTVQNLSRSSRRLQPVDVDGDGDTDIAYWNRDHTFAEWFENLDGLGQFDDVPKTLASNLPDAWKWFEDWDQDGDFDILEQSGSALQWYENQGDLNFSTTPRALFDNFVLSRGEFEVVDLNRDGHTDLIFARERKIQWARNDGTNRFAVTDILTLADDFPYVFPFADKFLPRTTDVDGDGDLDIMVALNSTDNDSAFRTRGGLRWYENEEQSGEWVERSKMPVVKPTVVYAHDVDLDGDEDLIVGDFSPIYWYENTNGLGEFEAAKRIPGGSSEVVNLMPPVDLNQDGFEDLIYVSDFALMWQLYSEDENSFLPAEKIMDLADFDTFVATVDVDQDHAVDLIVLGGDNRWNWMRNQDGSNLSKATILDKDTNEVLQGFADVNGDGHLDLISGRSGNSYWRENLPSDTFSGPIPLLMEPRAIQFPISYQSGRLPNRVTRVDVDLDGDGDFDVVRSHAQYVEDGQWVQGRLVWLENMGETLGAPRTVNRQSNATLDVADIDGDGDRDVVSLSAVSNSLSWFESRIAGDCNDDGIFDSSDLVAVFQAGLFDKLLSVQTTFNNGDWNGDGRFDNQDLIDAFEFGHYQL